MKHNIALICIVLLSLLVIVSSTQAEILIPDPATGGPAFIQTSGPTAPFNNGDYRASNLGDNARHEIVINVACTPGETYVFQLFDPSMDQAGNPPGNAPDGTPRVLDEVDNLGAGVPDNTFFQLFRGSPPGAALTPEINYAPGSQDEAWTTLYTLGPLPANPTPGVNCGEFTVTARTGVNDENGWRFRLLGGGVPETFDPTLGPDGAPGTGDESWIGLVYTSYQHSFTGCQNFYWFVNDGDTNLYMINFDMDNFAGPPVPPMSYTQPDGTVITGTVSGNGVWNDAPAPQAPRPGFADMSIFNPPGDLAGDAVAAPVPGSWSASLCVNGGLPFNQRNQYSFEVPNRPVYLTLPEYPDVFIVKDDFVVLRNSPGSTTYTITIDNQGPGAAMPIVGPEMVDQIPPGMVFDFCTVNPPLVGTCQHVGGGVVEFDFEAQSPTTPAYLAGSANPGPGAPSRIGTVTLGVDIVAGLANGTTLDNGATIDWTDIFNNDYVPRSDNDIDIVQSMPAVTISLSADRPNACEGDVVEFTYDITNVGNERLDPFNVTDTVIGAIPMPVTFLDPGDTTQGTATYTILAGDLPLRNDVTVTGTSIPSAIVVTDFDSLTIGQRANCGNTTDDGDDDDDDGGTPPPPPPPTTPVAVLCLPGQTGDCLPVSRLPATGESPWSKWRLPIFGAGIAAVSLGLVMVRRRAKV